MTHADRDLRTLATLIEARTTIAVLRARLAEYEEPSHGYRVLDEPGSGQGSSDRVGAEVPRNGNADGLHRLSPTRTHKAGEANKILRHCLRRLGFTAAWKRAELTGHQILELLDAIREYGRAWLHHEAASFIGHYGRKDAIRSGAAKVLAEGEILVDDRSVALTLPDERGEGCASPDDDCPSDSTLGIAGAPDRESLYQAGVNDAERIAETPEPGRSGVAGGSHPADGRGDREGAIHRSDDGSSGEPGEHDAGGYDVARECDGERVQADRRVEPGDLGDERTILPVLSGAEVNDGDQGIRSDRSASDHTGDEGGDDRSSAGMERSHGSGIREGLEIFRGLSSAIASHVGRFFSRAKSFTHELILAGAMALNGPAPLDAQDLAEVDRQSQVQAQYFDRFHREVLINPPAVLSEQPIATGPPEPMTAAEFAARAEQYGNSAFGAAHTIERRRIIRSGLFNEERRVLSPVRHCDDCPPLADMGWQPLGTLPDIGQTECMLACRCSFEYRGPNGKTHGSDRHGRKVA